MNLRELIPEPIKSLLRPVYRSLIPYPDKYTMELAYWKRRWQAEGGRFDNSFFRKLMLGMADEKDNSFLAGKVVADFGCGPQGTLAWAELARERIGIDILADVYASHFDLSSHSMRYVKSTEETIPLPTAYVDVLYTLNAMDHVNNFDVMCHELLRILKPGGHFIGGFNLDEPWTPCEPQTLTEERVKACLLNYLDAKIYRLATKGPPSDPYIHFFDGTPSPPNGERYLRVRATKRG